MKSRVQELAEKINLSYDDFVGEMRKRRCSEPTALKIWRSEYENFDNCQRQRYEFEQFAKSGFCVEGCHRNIASEIKVRR